MLRGAVCLYWREGESGYYSGIGACRGQRVAVHAALSIRTGHRTVQSPSRRGFLGQLFFRRRIEKGTGERVAVRQRPPCLTDN